MGTILICEPPSSERDTLVQLLGLAGHQVSVTAEAEAALSLWRAQRHELAVLDDSPALGGGALAQRMKAESPLGYMPVVLILPRPDPDLRVTALAIADDAVGRPYRPAELVARIEALLRSRRIVDDLRAARLDSDARAAADPLTGLHNRIFLGDRLNEEYKRATRYNEPLSLLLIAIEDLKGIGEQHGVVVRDRVVVAVANATLRSLRQIDIVTRFGPAELAALLPNTHFAGSLTCAERLYREVAALAVDHVKPTVSMGISFYPGKDVTDPADLLRIGTRALERAREEGPANICLVQHQGYLFHPR